MYDLVQIINVSMCVVRVKGIYEINDANANLYFDLWCFYQLFICL